MSNRFDRDPDWVPKWEVGDTFRHSDTSRITTITTIGVNEHFAYSTSSGGDYIYCAGHFDGTAVSPLFIPTEETVKKYGIGYCNPGPRQPIHSGDWFRWDGELVQVVGNGSSGGRYLLQYEDGRKLRSTAEDGAFVASAFGPGKAFEPIPVYQPQQSEDKRVPAPSETVCSVHQWADFGNGKRGCNHCPVEESWSYENGWQ